jgi:hypothetical protein
MSSGCIRPGQPHRHDPPGRATGRLACCVGEAARLTGLSRDLLGDQMRRGNLACITAGRRRLITCSSSRASAPQDTTSSQAGHR